MAGHENVIAFGSCNRQNKPQNHWSVISSKNPSLFIFLGDSVYAKNNSIEGLETAFQNLSLNKFFREFRQTTEIIAVWDDHDYGVNDAGRHVSRKQLRQQSFLNYIGDGAEDNRYNQDGLYTSIDRRFVGGTTVKFILLDTRSHRDSHYIRSLGEIQLPLFPLFAAAIRTFCTVFGFGTAYNGDVLGEDQWQWLESTLQSSTADFNIIVSSIQVMTTNPAVESWSHFPVAKRRLFTLLQEINPRGLAFLSGDVHHGEISYVNVHRQQQQEGIGKEVRREDKWVEVTSSGLTHTCADSRINRFLCPLMLWAFSAHRLPTSTEDLYKQNNIYIKKNFGLISELLPSEEVAQSRAEDASVNGASNTDSGSVGRLKIAVHSVETGDEVLSAVVTSHIDSKANDDRISAILFPPTPTFSPLVANLVLAGAFVSLFFMLMLCWKCLSAKKRIKSAKYE
jgi:alkaline phosphatase D